MTENQAVQLADALLVLFLQHQAIKDKDLASEPKGLATSIAEFRHQLILDLQKQPAAQA